MIVGIQEFIIHIQRRVQRYGAERYPEISVLRRIAEGLDRIRPRRIIDGLSILIDRVRDALHELREAVIIEIVGAAVKRSVQLHEIQWPPFSCDSERR